MKDFETKLKELSENCLQETLKEQSKRFKVWEKYKKLSDKNTIAYNKRQEEINRLLD